jgi:hypothetical protein
MFFYYYLYEGSDILFTSHMAQLDLFDLISDLISEKFPLAPMGVLAHRLRTLDRSFVPPSTRAEI